MVNMMEELPGFDGYTAFGGALRFHDVGDSSWIDLWGSGYGTLIPDLRFFASDTFGTMYGLNAAGHVAIFWSETGEVEEIGVGQEEFFAMIVEDPNSTINLDLYREAVEKIGAITSGQHFAFKVETALGGQLAVENLMIMSADDHMRALGVIAQQIHDMPPGSVFEGAENKP